jgi:flagellar M-ring protein FliF
MDGFRDTWKNLEPRGQLTLIGSALLVVVTLFFLFQYASRPSYSTIAAGLDPADASEVQNALAGAGVDFKLENGGTAVAVRKGQESDAQVALASEGLPKGSHVGFEIFDESSISASDFQQKVDYQRALEGEIARTVEEIDGVQAAQVQLVLPEDSLFADESPQASAAVLLTSNAGLESSAVAGIARLVSSSVKGLKTDNVTITDSSGSLLWPRGDGVGGASATTALEAEARYNEQLSAQIQAFLVSTLGAGKAQARVHANLDLDQKTIDKVTYAKKGTPLVSETEEETLTNAGGTRAGAAGTTSNVPTFAAGSESSGQSEYAHTTEKTTMGVNKTVERTTVVPGEVKKLDVALLVDASVPADTVSALRTSVGSLAGIDEERGDTISVSTVDFAKQPDSAAPKASPIAAVSSNPFGLLKWIGLVLGLAAFLFMVRRSVKRRENEPVALEPTWLREIQGARPIAELEAGQTMQIDQNGGQRKALRDQVDEIVNRQPEQIAQQVSTWMNE